MNNSVSLSDKLLKEQKLKEWIKIQKTLKKKIILESNFETPIQYVAGMDISFSSIDNKNAIASLVVLDFETMNLVYERYEPCQMLEPYIPGFLAFREVDILCNIWMNMVQDVENNKLEAKLEMKIEEKSDNKGTIDQFNLINSQSTNTIHSISTNSTQPINIKHKNQRPIKKKLMNNAFKLTKIPSVVLLDGNGIHHHNYFGLACHFGILMNVPSIGVAKNFLEIHGMNRAYEKELEEQLNTHEISHVFAKSPKTKKVLSALIRSENSKKPVFASPGHLVSMEDCVNIVKKCLIHKNPEPIRKADLGSRNIVRKWDKEIKENKRTEWK